MCTFDIPEYKWTNLKGNIVGITILFHYQIISDKGVNTVLQNWVLQREIW